MASEILVYFVRWCCFYPPGGSEVIIGNLGDVQAAHIDDLPDIAIPPATPFLGVLRSECV